MEIENWTAETHRSEDEKSSDDALNFHDFKAYYVACDWHSVDFNQAHGHTIDPEQLPVHEWNLVLSGIK